MFHLQYKVEIFTHVKVECIRFECILLLPFFLNTGKLWAHWHFMYNFYHSTSISFSFGLNCWFLYFVSFRYNHNNDKKTPSISMEMFFLRFIRNRTVPNSYIIKAMNKSHLYKKNVQTFSSLSTVRVLPIAFVAFPTVNLFLHCSAIISL